MSERLVIYSQLAEPMTLSGLLAALQHDDELPTWAPRQARDEGERRWRAGTLVSGMAAVSVSNGPVSAAKQMRLVQSYARAPEQLLDVLQSARRVYVVESDDSWDLTERVAAAIAELTDGVIVVDATGDLLDVARFRQLRGSDDRHT